MKLKKVGIVLLAPLTMLAATACTGNRNCFDGCSNETNTLNYVVVSEGGHYVLHSVQSWSDSSSDSATITTSCCGNYIWLTANNTKFYRSMPPAYAYDLVCSEYSATHEGEHVDYTNDEVELG